MLVVIGVQRAYERVLLGVVRHRDIEVAGILIDHTSAGGSTGKPRGATAKFNDLDISYGIELDSGAQPNLVNAW
jgi:hypothetical protein